MGYALTWIFKWVQYDFTIPGGGMLGIGFGQSFYRMTRGNQTAPDVSIVSAIISCISKASVFTTIFAVLIFYIGKLKERKTPINQLPAAFALIALMPIAWYVVLANHTILHSYFVYRHSVLYMLGLLLAIYSCCLEDEINIKAKKK